MVRPLGVAATLLVAGLVMPTVSLPAQDLDLRAREAGRLIDRYQLAAARAILDAAGGEQSSSAAIPYQMARLCYAAGDVDTALEHFARAADLAPEWTAPRLRAGEIAFEQGDMGAAAALYREVLRLDPERTAIWIRYGDALARRPTYDFEGPRAAYAAAIDSDPASRAAHIALAYYLYNQQQFAAAEAAIETLLAASPEDPYALNLRAQLHRVAGEDLEALAALATAIEHVQASSGTPTEDPARRRFRIDLLELQSRTLLSLGRLADAERVARRLVMTDPANLEGLYLLGTSMVRAGKAAGRDHLIAFQRLSDARLHRQLGINYLNERDEPRRAAEEFRAALRINPNDRRALTGLGAANNVLEQPAGALAALSRAWQAGASGADWYREWILALHAAGRTDEAIELWQQIRADGTNLGPNVAATLGRFEGVC